MRELRERRVEAEDHSVCEDCGGLGLLHYTVHDTEYVIRCHCRPEPAV